MVASKITIAEVSREWLAMKKLSVKQSTYAKYYSIVSKHIFPEIGEIPLSQVNSSIVNDFTCRKLGIDGKSDPEDGKEGENILTVLAPKTARDVCTILMSIIRYGEREYQLGSLAGNMVLPKAKRASREVLNTREIRKIENYIWENPENLRCAGILLCIYTGMRLGEICALKWSEIDLRRHILYISQTIQRIPAPDHPGDNRTILVTDEPKSFAGYRSIPISTAVLPLLKRLHAGTNPGHYFLTNSEKPVEPRNYQYFFKKTLQASGVRKVNFHTLRHTFATRCVETGMDARTLSELLGHSSINLTLNYYVHSSLESKRRQINRLHIPDRKRNPEYEASQL